MNYLFVLIKVIAFALAVVALLLVRPYLVGLIEDSVRPSRAAQTVIDELAYAHPSDHTHISDVRGLEDHGGMEEGNTNQEFPLTEEEQKVYLAQWHAAKVAATELDTPMKALMAGYLPAGRDDRTLVASHWINWQLVGKPFDPAKPAMLLFTSEYGSERLVGFSYYVRASKDAPPEGFAGNNDWWHAHHTLCVENGRGEDKTEEECPGQWIIVEDIWMLHTWIVRAHKDTLGRFATFAPDFALYN